MKKNYETPTAEMLEFNYTDVVTASGAITRTTNKGCADSPIVNPSGWTEHGNSSAECQKLKPANKKNWNHCDS